MWAFTGGNTQGEQHFADLWGAGVFHSGGNGVKGLRYTYPGVSEGQEQRNMGITRLRMGSRATGSPWMSRQEPGAGAWGPSILAGEEEGPVGRSRGNR